VKVAIIIPYQNDRGYLGEALKSVERQTYPADLIELIEVQSENTVGHNLN
jgi:glycosyltransferase involved in cell wall biosynthesis